LFEEGAYSTPAQLHSGLALAHAIGIQHNKEAAAHECNDSHLEHSHLLTPHTTIRLTREYLHFSVFTTSGRPLSQGGFVPNGETSLELTGNLRCAVPLLRAAHHDLHPRLRLLRSSSRRRQRITSGRETTRPSQSGWYSRHLDLDPRCFSASVLYVLIACVNKHHAGQ